MNKCSVLDQDLSIRYSEDMQEMAYDKDAIALLRGADVIIPGGRISKGIGFESFFEAGRLIPAGMLCFWITCHSDNETALLFFVKNESEALEKIRSLEGRETDLEPVDTDKTKDVLKHTSDDLQDLNPREIAKHVLKNQDLFAPSVVRLANAFLLVEARHSLAESCPSKLSHEAEDLGKVQSDPEDQNSQTLLSGVLNAKFTKIFDKY